MLQFRLPGTYNSRLAPWLAALRSAVHPGCRNTGPNFRTGADAILRICCRIKRYDDEVCCESRFCLALQLQTDFCHGIPYEGRVFASVDLDGVEAGVAGLAGDCGAVGAVTGALGDEPGAEGMSAEFGEGGGVVAGVFGAAADGFVDRSSRQRCRAEVAVLGDGPQQWRPGSGTGYSPAADVSGERFPLPQ